MYTYDVCMKHRVVGRLEMATGETSGWKVWRLADCPGLWPIVY